MAIQLINPDGLAEPQGYTQVAVATGSRMVFVAGQVGQDADGTVAGDLAAQTAQALRNVGIALEAAGATFGDVAKTTVYVAGASHETQSAVWQVVRSSPIGAAPSTLVGVPILGYRGQLVEIEAIALLD